MKYLILLLAPFVSGQEIEWTKTGPITGKCSMGGFNPKHWYFKICKGKFDSSVSIVETETFGKIPKVMGRKFINAFSEQLGEGGEPAMFRINEKHIGKPGALRDSASAHGVWELVKPDGTVICFGSWRVHSVASLRDIWDELPDFIVSELVYSK